MQIDCFSVLSQNSLNLEVILNKIHTLPLENLNIIVIYVKKYKKTNNKRVEQTFQNATSYENH